MMQVEETVHKQVCTYLKRQYPKVMFNTDLSGLRLTPGLYNKVQDLRSGRGWPDIMIPKRSGEYSGLYIELKANRDSLYTKKGTYKSQKQKEYMRVGRKKIFIGYVDHIQEQLEMIEYLKNEGYYACFACGFEEARTIIDNYLSQQ